MASMEIDKHFARTPILIKIVSQHNTVLNIKQFTFNSRWNGQMNMIIAWLKANETLALIFL